VIGEEWVLFSSLEEADPVKRRKNNSAVALTKNRNACKL